LLHSGKNWVILDLARSIESAGIVFMTGYSNRGRT